MKTRHPLAAKLTSPLSPGPIPAAGAAGAQTIIQTYNDTEDTGTGDGSHPRRAGREGFRNVMVP